MEYRRVRIWLSKFIFPRKDEVILQRKTLQSLNVFPDTNQQIHYAVGRFFFIR
jgi:hypothetical protein